MTYRLGTGPNIHLNLLAIIFYITPFIGHYILYHTQEFSVIGVSTPGKKLALALREASNPHVIRVRCSSEKYFYMLL